MLSTLFSMTQKVASKSKKRTALSFRKLFPDLFFIFSDILCDHRCRLFYNSTPLCKHIFCNFHIQFIILNHEDPDTRYGSRLKCDRLSRKIGKLSDIAVFLYNKDTSGIKIGSCPLILFFPSIHGKTAPDTVYCPLSQKFVSFRKIHFCKYRLISDPPAGFCRKFCIDPCIGSTHIPVKIGCIKGTTDHDLWQFLFFPVISSHADADR